MSDLHKDAAVLRRAADRLRELSFKYDSQFDDMQEEAALVMRHAGAVLRRARAEQARTSRRRT